MVSNNNKNVLRFLYTVYDSLGREICLFLVQNTKDDKNFTGNSIRI